MRNLSTEILLDSYRKAIELELEKSFIDLLEEEIRQRGLQH